MIFVPAGAKTEVHLEFCPVRQNSDEDGARSGAESGPHALLFRERDFSAGRDCAPMRDLVSDFLKNFFRIRRV